MLAITLYDLRYRARQFLIAVVGAGLLFAMSLLLSGLAASYRLETAHVVAQLGADSWVVPAGAAGPFTSFGPASGTALKEVAAAPGVTRADPLVIANATALRTGMSALNVVVVGHVLGGVGDTRVASGREPRVSGEAVADTALHVRIGGRFAIDGRLFTVVGTTSGEVLGGGTTPIVLTLIGDAQRLSFAGRPLETAIITRGIPSRLPADLHQLTNAQARVDTLRPLKSAIGTLSGARTAMWAIATLVVGALIYVSALERVRDFAVLKALGSSSVALFVGVAIQGVVVTALAAGVAALVASLLKPLLSALPLSIPTSAYLELPVIAVGAGLLSSLFAVRRATGVDPSKAFS